GRSLMPWSTVRNNVLLPLRHKKLSGGQRRELVEESLESVGLTRFIDHYPWQLSGGMQQRVAIARALAYQPSILLMDEPFASVDAQTRGDLEDLVLRVREEYGITILFVTHDIDESVYLADRVVVLTHANGDGDIGYLGYVPAMIGRVQGIKFQMISASEVEGTSVDDNWQNIMVKGNSSIRTPQDLAGKTIAVNALKGVGEVMIKAALRKVGVNPNSIRLLAMPFPTMRTALRNGQVDAIWTPEPFLSQALNLDNAR